jgi:hypothetical protein
MGKAQPLKPQIALYRNALIAVGAVFVGNRRLLRAAGASLPSRSHNGLI